MPIKWKIVNWIYVSHFDNFMLLILHDSPFTAIFVTVAELVLGFSG